LSKSNQHSISHPEASQVLGGPERGDLVSTIVLLRSPTEFLNVLETCQQYRTLLVQRAWRSCAQSWSETCLLHVDRTGLLHSTWKENFRIFSLLERNMLAHVGQGCYVALGKKISKKILSLLMKHACFISDRVDMYSTWKENFRIFSLSWNDRNVLAFSPRQ
jgi:hypothetical protein